MDSRLRAQSAAISSDHESPEFMIKMQSLVKARCRAANASKAGMFEINMKPIAVTKDGLKKWHRARLRESTKSS